MNRSVKGTIVFAFFSGVSISPFALLLSFFIGWNVALKISLWFYIGLYCILMARWSSLSIRTILCPIGLLLGAAVWPHTYTGFFMLTLGVFCWIRSGICFQTAPIRCMSAELITVMFSVCILFLLGSYSPTAWALRVFIFFMIQSLYFFIIPFQSVKSKEIQEDSYERAFTEVEKLLREGI
jgi:hypothetical protein